jgi:four helix bundle suffix protein
MDYVDCMDFVDSDDPLIPKHGGYRRLKSFQVARVVYDVTVRFCDRYIDRRSRTRDQMVQAARSGVQNIAEGSQASGTSKKFELKLTSVARASLEELLLDYEDFLRQRNLAPWPRDDPRRARLIARRPQTADDFADWVRREQEHGLHGRRGLHGRSMPSTSSMQSMSPNQSMSPTQSTIAANGTIVLIVVACSLLDRQIAVQAQAFASEGGFSERLSRHRRAKR